MREVNESDLIVRHFLLDQLGEKERERLEERFLTDGNYRESVLIAEDDLIDDYLEDTLSADERERFLSHYLSTPQQRRKLQIAKSIKKYVAANVPTSSTPSDVRGPQHGSGSRGSIIWLSLRKPWVLIPLAAALAVVVGLGAMKLIENSRFNKEQARRSAQEQELARLNDPSLPAQQRLGGAAFSMTLPPVSVRGIGGAKFPPPPDATSVALLLVLEEGSFQSYEVDLQKLGSPEQRTVRHLFAESTPAGKAIPLIIPARLLTRGHYQLRLRGVTSANTSEEVEEYTFEVTGK